ncbi:aminotransferase class I/II-fold pyridoxal phosphate-dependent enzyme [Microbacterium sp. ZW T5_56]|uniref:aminotransferase class I/II-fold pyridoxal phosphate-dependent enzyme n=1 Tax=Microbacterium sp. ZW T5_56 TaxID=3378081 RepID=UPI00385520A9
MDDHFSGLRGATAAELADELRTLIERGALAAGDALPPVRTLADLLGMNRNTVVAAYRQLAAGGLVESRGRAGTRVSGAARSAQDGFAPDSVLRDIGSGNPDPARIPDPSRALAHAVGRPILYGEAVVDPELERWARDWVGSDLQPEAFSLTITSGAVDAVERLLAQALVRDDAVALEDPCFLASIHTVRLGGYRAVPVPVDEEGMTVAGLRAALDAGVRAIVVTPRAQNPTGACLTARRAADLRSVLTDHPYVLIVEDDHFSMLSREPYESLIGPDHRRFALVRSVSKFLGPDMCLAVTASDPDTAARLGLRLSPGTTWVSHILQRLVAGLVTDADVRAGIAAAADHYAARNAAFATAAASAGLPVVASDGLNVWLPLPVPARGAAEQLMRRGWLARTGDEFRLIPDAPSHHLRLTVHELDDDDRSALVTDLVAAIAAAS